MISEQIGRLAGYELLDSGLSGDGQGYRLERFGEYVLQRPDPAVLWRRVLSQAEWAKADAVFLKRGGRGGGDLAGEKGNWQIRNGKMPEKWTLEYAIPGTKEKIYFYAKLNPFKHTGVFPEQAANWNFIAEKILARARRGAKEPLNFLNLFGYTGIATIVAAKLGARATHVDASKPSLSAAKENMLASGLPENAIRWILDDALKFVKREVRRGAKYDAVIMDPPAFGRGAKGEVWKFSEGLPILLQNVRQLCSDNFLFFIINAYAVSVPALLLRNLLQDFAEDLQRVNASPRTQTKNIEYGELVLQQKVGNRLLSTGIFGRLS